MPFHKTPPRGYRKQDFPLPHDALWLWSLSADVATKDATIATILRTSEDVNAAEGINVNPSHGSFAEEQGTLIHQGSIVPKIMISLHAHLTQTAEETDNVRMLRFHWMPIYSSFIEPLLAADSRTNTDCETLLMLEHDTTNKDVFPDYGTKLTGNVGQYPMSTVNDTEVFGDPGLTTNTSMEAVAFNQTLFYNALNHFSNQGMLRSMIGKIHTGYVSRDKAYTYYSNNFTHPRVKRGNPFTYCGILFWVPITDFRQFGRAADRSTTDHIDFGLNVQYDEWNPDFDQTGF